MNRRGFLTSLAVLATSAAMPTVPSIPLVYPRLAIKTALNAAYGKHLESVYRGGLVVYRDIDSVILMNIRSSYPT